MTGQEKQAIEFYNRILKPQNLIFYRQRLHCLWLKFILRKASGL